MFSEDILSFAGVRNELGNCSSSLLSLSVGLKDSAQVAEKPTFIYQMQMLHRLDYIDCL
jgi:hypothetical protein